jgi:hypothetical protein
MPEERLAFGLDAYFRFSSARGRASRSRRCFHPQPRRCSLADSL